MKFDVNLTVALVFYQVRATCLAHAATVTEATTRSFFLDNRRVEHCWHHIQHMGKKSGKCSLHGTACELDKFEEDKL